MKAPKSSEAKIAFVFKQVEDGVPVAEVCRKFNISDATFYHWRKKYSGLMPSEMKRLRQLEEVHPPECLPRPAMRPAKRGAPHVNGASS